jgi:cytidylate kinase
MNWNPIISIGRQYGSGGREIGQRLAKQGQMAYYDKELLKAAAEESGIRRELFEQSDEKRTNSLLYSLSTGSFAMGAGVSLFHDLPLDDRLFLIQADVIKKTAAKGPCVFIGRCADYILRDEPRCVRVFIHAPLAKRVERIARLQNISPQQAETEIGRTDKRRMNYHNYYANEKWGDARAYHLCIDSSVLGVEKTAEYILDFVEKMTPVRGQTVKE